MTTAGGTSLTGRAVRAVAALALVAGLGAWAAPSASADAAGVTETPTTVDVGDEPDGTAVALDVSVFTSGDATGRRPAVVLAHGFGGSKAGLEGQARTLAAAGYVALTYTARGFGDSGGRIHLDSPDYEIADVSVLIDELAARDDVQLDAVGDPRVGVAGGSYGGAVALLVAGLDDRVDAIVPAITWNDLSQSLFPQLALDGSGDAPDADPGVFKRRWAGLFFSSGLRAPLPGDDPLCGRFDPTVCALYAGAASSGRPTPQILALLRASSPAAVLDDVTAPTLLLQGEQDSLFGLDQGAANAAGLAAAGATVKVTWIDGGHDAGGDTSVTEDLTTAALGWFDHHLRGVGPDPGTAFTFAVPQDPLAGDGPLIQQLEAYPPSEDDDRTLTLTGDVQPVVSPPGGEPTAVTGLPGTGGALAAAAGLTGAGYALAALPGATATFESEALDTAATVAGAPRVRLLVTSSATDATLFASLWVVDATDTATLPRQLVSPVHLDGLTPGEPTEVEVALPASAYAVEAGEHVRVVVASTDAAYAVPADGRVYQVGLADDAVVTLPTAVGAVDVDGAGGVPLPLVLAVAGLALAAAVAAGISAGRRRGSSRDDALAGVPLVVDGLVKSYSNGFRAVDGVTWRAERGQVVGLLGPNGAGKTTTMRMLVGLIRADGGSIHVLGEPVVAGAEILSRVGALIEGPGFLPHLTGRQNLDAYWAATGRPAGDAGIDEALEVASLGTAVDRPVRSYSQGMRQRLGIAQAMLGRPELLLLDEPTNGLDPQQIKAMREVLADYAAAGRTVVVSSHLLSEVEQTCSHVVVMHRGRVVMSGAVAELVDSTDTVVVQVGSDDDPADVEAAAVVARSVDGVDSVHVDPGGRLVVGGVVRRALLVSTLVDAGVAVTGVDGRRHLEEVFMQLISGGEPVESQVAP